MFSQSENIIPNKIHAVWLGSPPSEEILKNIKRWKRTNKWYQVHLWIDSGTYQSDDQIAECKSLEDWAEKNDIIICDVNPSSDYKPQSSAFLNMSSFYEAMLNQQYYNDNINGLYKNLAMASDILRFEVLHQFGGVYIDINDIYPARPLKVSMNAPFGFYCHISESNSINNDVLASIPQGTLIDTVRKKINANLKALYNQEPDTLLKAHRNPDFASSSLYSGSNPRFRFEVEEGGPGAVAWAIMYYQTGRRKVPEASSYIQMDRDVAFNQMYFRELTTGQAGSWYGRKIETYEQAEAIFRSYVIDYFNQVIDGECKNVENLFHKKNESKDRQFFGKDSSGQLIKLLQQLRKKLNAFPPYLPMKELVNVALTDFSSNELESLNKCNQIISRLTASGENLERIIDFIRKEEKLSPQDLVDGLRIGNAVPLEERRKLSEELGYRKYRDLVESGEFNATRKFIKRGVDIQSNEPDYDALDTFIKEVEEIKVYNENSVFFKPPGL